MTRDHAFEFNRGTSRIAMQPHPGTGAWIVWRDDNGHAARETFRTHRDKASALQDFKTRVTAVLAKMERER